MPRDPSSKKANHLRRRIWLCSILFVLCFLSARPSAGQERMRIAWAGSTPSNTPIWVADQKGFFKKNGLSAEVIAISASTIVIQELLTGELDLMIAYSATLVTSGLVIDGAIMFSMTLTIYFVTTIS